MKLLITATLLLFVILIPVILIVGSSEEVVHTGIFVGNNTNLTVVHTTTDELDSPLCKPYSITHVNVSEVNSIIKNTTGKNYILIVKGQSNSCGFPYFFAPCYSLEYYYGFLDTNTHKLYMVKLDIPVNSHIEKFAVNNSEVVVIVKEYYPFNMIKDEQNQD